MIFPSELAAWADHLAWPAQAALRGKIMKEKIFKISAQRNVYQCRNFFQNKLFAYC